MLTPRDLTTPRMFSCRPRSSFQRVLNLFSKSPLLDKATPLGRFASPKVALDCALRNASSIVAHRGGSKIGPENTKGSLTSAFNKGSKGVEFDIQITSDNQLIILHDDTLERTAVPYARAKDLLPETIDEVIISCILLKWNLSYFVPPSVVIFVVCTGRIPAHPDHKCTRIDVQDCDKYRRQWID